MPGLGSSQDLLGRRDSGVGAAGLPHAPASAASTARSAVVGRDRGRDRGIRARAQEFEENRDLVRGIIAEGCEKARDVARQTLEEVHQAMGMNYR